MRTLNDLMTELVDELAASEVPDALAQPITLAALWADLARLAGEPLPRSVASRLDAPVALLTEVDAEVVA